MSLIDFGKGTLFFELRTIFVRSFQKISCTMTVQVQVRLNYCGGCRALCEHARMKFQKFPVTAEPVVPTMSPLSTRNMCSFCETGIGYLPYVQNRTTHESCHRTKHEGKSKPKLILQQFCTLSSICVRN